MKKIMNAIIVGCILITIAIIIGILYQHNIAFVFAGSGIIIIGIAFLSYVNRAK